MLAFYFQTWEQDVSSSMVTFTCFVADSNCFCWDAWRCFWRSWSALEASWRHLGSVLGYLGGFLGVLLIFKRSKAVLKGSWERLGGAWGRLGRAWETPGRRLGASLGCFFQSLKRLWSVLLENLIFDRCMMQNHYFGVWQRTAKAILEAAWRHLGDLLEASCRSWRYLG